MTEMALIAVAVLVAVGVGAIIVLHSHNNAAAIIAGTTPTPPYVPPLQNPVTEPPPTDQMQQRPTP